MKKIKVYAAVKEKFKIDMTLSVNPLGCSPAALKVVENLTLSDLNSYPDDRFLRIALGEKFGINPDNIVLGSGSEQLIKLVAQTFVKPGVAVLVQEGSFPLFTKEPLLAGGEVRYFDPNSFTEDIKPELIFISNPSTPTGEVFSKETIVNILTSFPEAVIVVDEANGEYFDSSSIPLITDFPRLIVLRTFSKVYGLAGIRAGMAFGSADTMTRIKQAQQPFAVSGPALKLAIAALADPGFIEKTVNYIRVERENLKSELVKLGFEVSNSVTNNLFISSKSMPMRQVQVKLNEMGVGVIDASFFPALNKKGFRISIKNKKTNLRFLKVIRTIVLELEKVAGMV